MASLRLTDHALFRTDEGGILFNAEHGAIFTLPQAACELVEEIREAGGADENASEGEKLEALKELRGTGVLVPAGRPSPGKRKYDPEGFEVETLVVETAQACNLRCSYCYAGGGSYGAAPALMEPETAAKAARYLVDNSGNATDLTLVLFGGEPLLNFPAVRAAVEEAAKLAGEKGKTLTLSITTNGTRFTPEVIDFLAANRVLVSVSIDGPESIHDANRRFAGGAPTYADVVRGVEGLKARGVPVGARVTLMPSQWGMVEEVFDHLSTLGFIEVGIAPASPVTRELLADEREVERLLAGFAGLADRFVKEADEGRLLPFANLIDLLTRLHKGRVKAVPCGAGYGYFAVDASGGLYLCHRLTGEEEFHVGSVKGGVDYARLRSALMGLDAPRETLCAGCWAKTLCAGGCHYENHLRERKLNADPGSMCGFIRGWLETGIRAYAQLCELNDGRVLSRLSGRGGC